MESAPDPKLDMKWPTPFKVGAIVLILTMLLVTLSVDVSLYTWGRRWTWQDVAIIMGPAVMATVIWSIAEMRSTRYLWPAPETPLRWTLNHLRRLPLIILGFLIVTHGVRFLVGYRISTMSLVHGLIHDTFKVSALYLGWLALAFGVVSFVRMREQAEHLLTAQRTLVEAKLAQLKGQLRPHFLFNTLNTISALMQVDVARADRLVTQLGDLLRASLSASERDIVPLREELALLRQYAGIMQERFVGRVSVHWDIATEALEVSVPTMLLQPLLENAFKNGVERSSKPERIDVRIALRAERLDIAIFNSGSVLSDELSEGFGLRSCRERLRLIYAEAATLALENQNHGVMVRVALPAQTQT